MTTKDPAKDAVRAYAPADRRVASRLLGDTRPLDQAGNHVHLSGDRETGGIALWLEPPPGSDEAYLGPVIAHGIKLGIGFHRLVLACANDALERGYERGYFTIKDPGLLRELKLMFRIDPVAIGWYPEGGWPCEWEVHVELADAIEQLRHIIAQLDRGSRR